MTARMVNTGPAPSRALVAAVLDWYQTKYGMRRPPLAGAGVLALVVESHRRGTPFPQHVEAARRVGCSVETVGYTLNVALERGVVRQTVQTAPGCVTMRDSVVRQIYYVPCPELAQLAG